MTAGELRARLEKELENRAPGAFQFRQRGWAGVLSTGFSPVDAMLGGGVPRGGLTEICGPPCSGRTSMMHHLLAQATRRGDLCALVDVHDAFSPHCAAKVGVALERVLWVRCQPLAPDEVGVRRQRLRDRSEAGEMVRRLGPIEQALKVTDIILQNGCFGLVVMDLADALVSDARRVPITSWFRFRRAVEGTTTALVLIEPVPCAISCATAVLQLRQTQVMFKQASDSSLGCPLPGRWVPRTFESMTFEAQLIRLRDQHGADLLRRNRIASVILRANPYKS
jgi:hypothetical protein